MKQQTGKEDKERGTENTKEGKWVRSRISSTLYFPKHPSRKSWPVLVYFLLLRLGKGHGHGTVCFHSKASDRIFRDTVENKIRKTGREITTEAGRFAVDTQKIVMNRWMSTWREFLRKETEFRDNQFAYDHTIIKWRSQDSNLTLLDSKAHVLSIVE